MIHDHKDTIYATATGSAQGAISVIRLSGPQAFQAVDAIFTPKKANITSLAQAKGYSIVFGSIVDGGTLIDEVLVSVFKAPHSYTGEDSLEISCHASPYIEQKLLELLGQQGLRHAQAGEFSMRAFMNAKLDLLQADAVADLIASRSAQAHRAAITQMRGGYSKTIGQLRQQMLDFASLLELELDFSEEDVEFADREQFVALLQQIGAEVERLLQAFRWGQVMKEGVPVAIVGKPNVGKSTLLNALLKEEKAIVSNIAGTTRDSIEDTIQLQGIQFRFIDTAGIRQSDDEVEKIGIARAMDKLRQARIVLYVCDLTQDTAEEICRAAQAVQQDVVHQQLVLIVNKIDEVENMAASEDTLKSLGWLLVLISAKNGQGVLALEELLVDAINKAPMDDGVVAHNVRHINMLEKVKDALQQIEIAFEQALPTDLIAIDVRQCLHYLGEITGQITTDELLGNIFGRFCIGK